MPLLKCSENCFSYLRRKLRDICSRNSILQDMKVASGEIRICMLEIVLSMIKAVPVK